MTTCPFCGHRDRKPGRESCGPCEAPVKAPRFTKQPAKRWPKRVKVSDGRWVQKGCPAQTHNLMRWRRENGYAL